MRRLCGKSKGWNVAGERTPYDQGRPDKVLLWGTLVGEVASGARTGNSIISYMAHVLPGMPVIVRALPQRMAPPTTRRVPPQEGRPRPCTAPEGSADVPSRSGRRAVASVDRQLLRWGCVFQEALQRGREPAYAVALSSGEAGWNGAVKGQL